MRPIRALVGVAVMTLLSVSGLAHAADFPLTITKVSGVPALRQTITIDVTGSQPAEIEALPGFQGLAWR